MLQSSSKMINGLTGSEDLFEKSHSTTSALIDTLTLKDLIKLKNSIKKRLKNLENLLNKVTSKISQKENNENSQREN